MSSVNHLLGRDKRFPIELLNEKYFYILFESQYNILSFYHYYRRVENYKFMFSQSTRLHST